MPKPLKVAGEVDGWCTKCRLVLNHRIVSMNGGTPHQAECLTCRTTHRWRAGAPGTATASSASRSLGTAAPARKPRASGPAAAALHRERWEQALGGPGVREMKVYDPKATFREGDLVNHGKFGRGVVMRVADIRKIEVLFSDETRMLAQGI